MLLIWRVALPPPRISMPTSSGVTRCAGNVPPPLGCSRMQDRNLPRW